MDLKRNFRSRTFALTMIVGGLLVLLLGLIFGLVGGAGVVWGTILVIAGLVDVAVGGVALIRHSRRLKLSVERTGTMPQAHGKLGASN